MEPCLRSNINQVYTIDNLLYIYACPYIVYIE